MPVHDPPPARDLRAYARTTQLRLIVGALALIFIVGDGLIWLIFGASAARLALLCTLAGLAPVVIIAGALIFMEKMVERALDE
jgi:hypothetical protein